MASKLFRHAHLLKLFGFDNKNPQKMFDIKMDAAKHTWCAFVLRTILFLTLIAIFRGIMQNLFCLIFIGY